MSDKYPREIFYGEGFSDDKYEYRNVSLPEQVY